MRKFPKLPNTWFNRTSFISFFLSWNVLGILVYRHFTRKEQEPDADEAKMSFKQKYLSVIYQDDLSKKIRHYKLKGFSVEEKEEVTLGDILEVKPKEVKENKTIEDITLPSYEL